MKKESRLRGPHKYAWSKKELAFIWTNFSLLTNQELADGLGLTLTLVRMKCYELGLKRMELEYWTSAQIKFLVNNFRQIGDKELAEIFNKKWVKGKGWSHKHIEKKRRHMKLVRTDEEKGAIKERNKKNGRWAMCPVKRWDKTGRAPEGTIRYWKVENSDQEFPVIKIGQGFQHWGRWAWKTNYGPIAKGMIVVFNDGNNRNLVPENLALMTRAEACSRNSRDLSDNYVIGRIAWGGDRELRRMIKDQPGLIELKRQQLKLQRAIYEQETK